MNEMFERTDDFLIEQVKRDANYTNQTSHFHPYYEIGYLVNGARSMTINHSLYNVERGCLIFVAKGELHKGFPNENNPSSVELINLYFHEKYLAPFYQLFGKDQLISFFSNHIIKIPVGRQEYVLDLFQKILYEYQEIDELSKELIRNYFCELISFLIRLVRKNTNSLMLPDPNNKIMEDAVKYIYYNYHKDLTLEEVAAKFNLSKSHFSKRFKSVTGFGYKEYLISVRIKEACNLLLTTNKSITEIAFLCGFNDSNYFGDAFRKANGISPHKYRKYQGLI